MLLLNIKLTVQHVLQLSDASDQTEQWRSEVVTPAAERLHQRLEDLETVTEHTLTVAADCSASLLTRTAELKTHHATTLSALHTQHAAALADAQQRYAGESEELVSSHAAELAVVRGRHARELSDTQVQFARNLAAAHATEIDDLKAQHESALSAVRDRHGSELSNVRELAAEELAMAEAAAEAVADQRLSRVRKTLEECSAADVNVLMDQLNASKAALAECEHRYRELDAAMHTLRESEEERKDCMAREVCVDPVLAG